MCEEISISAAWGHVSIKTWGEKDDTPIICIHGLLDNAGSFDRLIPLLPPCFYFICLDLPGHGFSSHFDNSLPIVYESYLLAIKLVADYFDRQKYILIGHSIGARFAALYSQLYSEEVSKLIMLDSGYTLLVPPKQHLSDLRESFKICVANFRNENVPKDENKPTLTYVGIIEKIMESRFVGKLSYEGAETLAQRMVRKVADDAYEFTHDKRNRFIVNTPSSLPYLKEMLERRPIKCEALLVFFSETYELYQAVGWMEWVELLKIPQVLLRGDHMSHVTTPDILAPVLSDFLLKERNKL